MKLKLVYNFFFAFVIFYLFLFLSFSKIAFVWFFLFCYMLTSCYPVHRIKDAGVDKATPSLPLLLRFLRHFSQSNYFTLSINSPISPLLLLPCGASQSNRHEPQQLCHSRRWLFPGPRRRWLVLRARTKASRPQIHRPSWLLLRSPYFRYHLHLRSRGRHWYAPSLLTVSLLLVTAILHP